MRPRLRLRTFPPVVEDPPPDPSAIGTWGLTTGTAVFPVAVPEGAAEDGLKVGSLTTQTTVRNRWPDGSIKYALVSCQVPTSGNYEVKDGPLEAGSFVPTWPTASVAFVISGTTWTATLPTFTASDTWSSGPIMRESRATEVPRNGITLHPRLQVLFDVRSFAAGGHRLDIQVLNCKDITAADKETYDVTVTINGTVVFTESGALHSILMAWRRVYNVGATLSDITPDFEPFYLSKAFPRYLSTIENPIYTFETTAEQNYGILKHGRMTPFMMTPGGRAEIGPYPFWVAQYLVHKGASHRECLLRNADAACSWPVRVSMPDGVSLISLDAMPNYWLDSRSAVGHANQSPNITRVGGPEFTGWPPDPNRPDNQHLPGLSFAAYMITGDRWYYDNMKYIANWGMLTTYPGDSTQWGVSFNREGGKGLLTTNGGRGFAWPFRELINAASYCADSDPDKAYFEQRVEYNLEWLENYITGVASRYEENPLGMPLWDRNTGFEDQMSSINTGFFSVGMWQLAYLSWAAHLAHLRGYGPLGVEFVNACCRLQIKCLTSGAVGYDPLWGCPFFLRMAKYPLPYPPNSDLSDLTHLSTMAQIWNHQAGNDSGYPVDDPVPGHRLPQPINGYYGPEAHMLTAMGVYLALTNAASALAYLNAHPGHLADMNGRSGFAIDFVD